MEAYAALLMAIQQQIMALELHSLQGPLDDEQQRLYNFLCARESELLGDTG
jgi:hypothetical protein